MTVESVFLECLSISAITTTIALFFCGIPICVTIWRKKTTEDISGVPFVMGLLGGTFWLRYGFLKMDMTMITVNVVGVSFFTIYCIFYLIYAKPKKFFAFELGFVCFLIGFMLVWIGYKPDIDYLGIVCMTFNIINFGAPLAGLGVVIRRRNCSTLPLPLCCANFLVSLQWFIYGMLIQDPYVLTPNGIGMCLSVVQLSLFVVFPLRENESSLLEKIAAWFSGRNKELDIEKANQTDLKHTTFLHIPAGKILSELSNNIGHFKRDSKAASFGASSRPPSYRSRSNSTPDIAAATRQN